MRFEDRMLLRLVSPSAQGAFFGESALQAIAAAAFDVDPGLFAGPWTAVFDRLRFAEPPAARQGSRVELRWDVASMRAEGALDTEARDGVLTGVDAIWEGAVVARAQIGGGRIDTVRGGFVGMSDIPGVVDAQLPPPAPGAPRRAAEAAELARRLGEAAGRPGRISANAAEDLLEPTGGLESAVASAGGAARVGGFAVHIAEDTPPAAVPMQMTVTAPIFIRDPAAPDFSLSALLRETRQAQAVLEAEAMPRAASPGLRRRVPCAAVWVVPATWFDDPHWPGAAPAARMTEAGQWLRQAGIALAPQPV